MNQPDLAEKRKFKRWQLIFYLRTFDQNTGVLLGHVVDISEEGLMLISDTPIPAEQTFHLGLDVPRETGPRLRIELEARSLWSRPDVNPDFYDTGFRILSITPYALRKLRHLIEDFKFEFKITPD